MNKFRMISILVLLAMLFSFAQVSPAKAEGTPPPDPSGWTQGSGIHFEVPNSTYLPVTLDSSLPVTLTLSSVPEVVDLAISADPIIGSAEFTLSGFAANTLYYQYADNGLDPVTITTDANGGFTFTQDLSESHHVWFRETPSTYYLYDNATGGDCASFGTWDWLSKTCTMTQDIYQTIFIQANGITLDGNGFSSLSSDYYYAVYSYGYSDVTIKNLNVSGSSYGILVYYGNNITVTNNTVLGGYYGIIAQEGSNFTLTDNTITDQYYFGIYLWDADNSTIRGNTISNAYYAGVYIDGYYYATDYWYYDYYYGYWYHYVYSYDYSSTNNTVYQNNFLGSYSYYNSIALENWATPAYYSYFNYGNYYGWYFYDTTGNSSTVFNLAAPDGGNYYSQFDESAEGCDNTNSDMFCDSAFVGYGGAVDYLPWTTQDAWLTPPNQAPTADAGGSYSGNEGSAIAMSNATASDPDLDTLSYSWTISDSLLCSFDFPLTLDPNLTCSDNGSYTATLSVEDGVNPAVSSDATVTVSNVAPALGAISVDVALVPVNTAINASATFTDPGTLDTHTASWDWGDGTSAGTVGSGSVDDSHSYSTPGVYTVKLTVTDNDLADSNESVYEFVVVYDPSGGFVTGGGWIDSPAGAYKADESLTGKANFGFVAKYKKGANVPDGNTQFQFKAGDLNFHSTSYEWLVVAGARAQFKGEGTINGAGHYGFMLTAIDGQINGGGGADKFRIKIWDMDNGDTVVYDNLIDGADDADPTTTLGGGSIVIHK